MGSIRMPAAVCPILALTYQQSEQADTALEWFKEKAGEVSSRSDPFAFIHTRYYEPEMGSNLSKIFYAFVELMDPADLVNLKLHSNQIEERLSVHGRRSVNLDPGYLEAAKLIPQRISVIAYTWDRASMATFSFIGGTADFNSIPGPIPIIRMRQHLPFLLGSATII